MNHHLTSLGIVTSLMVSVGMFTNLFMVLVCLRRAERISEHAPNDFVARITVRRTLRNELSFLLAQILLFTSSVWSIATVTPESPPLAITFYYVAGIIRVLVSLILCSCSLLDILDRTRIHNELGRLNVLHLQQEVDKMEAAKAVQEKSARLGLDVETPNT